MTLFSCKENISTNQDDIIVAGHKFKKTIINNEPLYKGATIGSDGFELESTFKLIEEDSLLVHGYVKSYFNNGMVRYLTNVRMGKNVGSFYIYRENGTIENYQFYDPMGEIRLSIMYDEVGNPINAEEFEIGQTILIVDQNHLDSIEVEFLIPDIPHFSRQLTLISQKCKIENVVNVEKGLNSSTLSFAKDSCDWIFQMKYYDQDSIVFGEEGVVFKND